MPHRRLGVAILGLGLAVVALAQATTPMQSPPLYDGIVPLEPYRWLEPPAGAAEGAQGASATVELKDTESPLVAVATPESVPQAQIFAAPGTLTLPPGTSSLDVSITPIPAEGAVADGHIEGNVYRMSVTDQDGQPVTAPPEGRVSVVLRAADPLLADAKVARLVDGVWQPLDSSPAGFGATFLAVVTDFGDFALIAPGPGPSASAAASVGVPASHSPAVVSATSPPTTIVPTGGPGGRSTPVGLIAVMLAISLTGIVVVGLQRWGARRRPRGRSRRPPQARRIKPP